MQLSAFAITLLTVPLAALLSAQSMPPQSPAGLGKDNPTWNGVLTDIDANGQIHVGARNYKASFGRDGTTFIPFLGSTAPRNFPTRIDRARVSVGGVKLPEVAAQPTLDAGFVAFTANSLVERYRLDEVGVEQQFVLSWLPNRGAIEVTVPVTTEFAVTATAQGHRFSHELGSFDYGRAVAIDALGERIDLETQWNGQAFVIAVPQAFVVRAALPLLIDPLLGNVTSLPSDSRRLEETDMAYNDWMSVFAVCWERVFSATDHDVYMQYLDANMDPVGGTVAVDLSTTTWRRPRIAGLHSQRCFLVVAEVAAGNVSPFHVGGRISSGATPTFGNQFVIAQANGYDVLSPDVGGDPAAVGGAFGVVYQIVFTQNDNDVYGRTVAADGTLGQPTTIDNSLANDKRPVISKGCGTNGGYERWGVVFQRDLGNGMCQPMFASLSRTAALLTSPTAWANPILAAGTQLTISSVSDSAANRRFLAAYSYDSVPGSVWQHFGLDLYGQTIAQSGIHFSNSIHTPGLDADCDGTRYVVSRTARLSSSSTYFVETELLGIVGASIVEQDSVSTTAVLGNYRAGSVIACRTGGGSLNPVHGLAWIQDEASGTFRVQAQMYHGRQVGDRLVARSTGCGVVGYTASAGLYPGGMVTVNVSAANGIVGMIAGFPVDIPVGPCPGCRQGATGNTIFGNSLTFRVPQDAAMVGTTVSVQPFAILAPGSGTCLGQIEVGDTIDMTVR